MNDSVVYVGTTSGLFRTIDSGNSWIKMTYDPVEAVSINPNDPNNIVIGIKGAGILMSFNSGTTWENRSQGSDGLDITKIVFDPNTPSKMYATVKGNTLINNGGVFVSTDSGLSWSPFNSGLNEKTAMALVIHPDGTLNLGTSESLYLRTPSASSWTQTKWIAGVQTITIDETDNNILYAGSKQFGLFRSTDKGNSWQNFGNASEDTIYSKIYQILTFQGNPDQLIVALKGRGLFVTTNGGTNWNQVTTGLKADRVMSLSNSPSTFLAGLNRGGAMRSTDGGNSWFAVNSGLLLEDKRRYLTVNELSTSSDGNIVYAATEGQGLYKSTDSGINWSRVTEPGLPSDPGQWHINKTVAVDPMDSNIVYTGFFQDGTYKRVGTSWTKLSTGADSGYQIRRVIISLSGSNKLLALHYHREAEISVNGGTSWQPFTADNEGFMYLGFFSLSENPFNTNILLGSTNKGLYQSVDGGFTWANMDISSGLESTILTGTTYSSSVSNLVFAGDMDGKLYCSNDGGLSWQRKTDPLLGAPITGVIIQNGILYILTDGTGILKDSSPSCSSNSGVIYGTVYFMGLECNPLNMRVPPCDGPYSNYEVIVYDESGTLIIDRTFTDNYGEYTFTMLPGTYVIYSQTVDINMNPVAIPNTIQLNINEQIEFDINIDSGIK